jgi:hypothetical protein
MMQSPLVWLIQYAFHVAVQVSLPSFTYSRMLAPVAWKHCVLSDVSPPSIVELSFSAQHCTGEDNDEVVVMRLNLIQQVLQGGFGACVQVR